ncbi:MAG: hypothetical protein ABSH51_18215 [Solirubrobacteraceae bacterium]
MLSNELGLQPIQPRDLARLRTLGRRALAGGGDRCEVPELAQGRVLVRVDLGGRWRAARWSCSSTSTSSPRSSSGGSVEELFGVLDSARLVRRGAALDAADLELPEAGAEGESTTGDDGTFDELQLRVLRGHCDAPVATSAPPLACSASHAPPARAAQQPPIARTQRYLSVVVTSRLWIGPQAQPARVDACAAAPSQAGPSGRAAGNRPRRVWCASQA